MNYQAIKKNTPCRGSALITFSFVLALISCVASGYLFVQWRKISTEKNGFETARIQLEDQVASLETDLQGALKEQQQLKKDRDAEVEKKAGILAELADAKVSSKSLSESVEKLKNERDSLKKLAVQMKSQASEIPDLVASAAGQNGTTTSFSPSSATNNAVTSLMKLKTINRTFNFVVFDLVPGATFRVGDAAVVERDGQWISDLKIKQVYAQFVSAEIRKEDDDNLLQIGDSVKRV